MKATGELSGPKQEKGRKESDLEYAEHLLHARKGMILYIFKLDLTTQLYAKHYYLHFIGKETEAYQY